MSALVLAAVGVAAAAVALVRTVLGEMLQEEVRTRLGLIPFGIIRLACARVPEELRADLAAEWEAELEFMLTGTDGMPVTRLLRGIRFSAGLLFAARRIAGELGCTGRKRTVRFLRVVSGLALAVFGLGGVVAGTVLFTEHQVPLVEFAGGSCMALTWLVGGIWLASAKPLGSTWVCLLPCAANVFFYLHQANTWRLVWAALFLAAFLVDPAFKLMTIRWDRQVRHLIAKHDELYPDCTECFASLRPT